MAPSLAYPYVLFDLGSTLIYFDGDWDEVIPESFRAAAAALRSFGYNLDEAAFSEAHAALAQAYYQKRDDEYIEYTSEHVLREALLSHSIPQPDPAHLREALRQMYAVSQAHWHVEPDAALTLAQIRASGRRMGIISNAGDDDDVQALVDKAGIRPYFNFILSSAAFGARKPGTAIFKKALAYWNAAPDEAVMVGDTLGADIEGANLLGITSVWIRRRVDTPANRALAEKTRPSYIIDSLTELIPLLDLA